MKGKIQKWKTENKESEIKQIIRIKYISNPVEY